MNDEQRDLARRLAAHPRFEWRPGMLALEDPSLGNWQPGDYRWRIITGAPDLAAVTAEHDIHEAPYMPYAFARAVPDLTDAATGGVLLGMLGPGWSLDTNAASIELRGPCGKGGVYVGDSLAEACARALLDQWGDA